MPFSLTTERAPLLHALGTILKAVESRTPIPILTHLRLDAEGNTLSVTGTDLDIQVTALLQANVEMAGSITVAAQAFRDLVRKAPDKSELRLSHDDVRKLTTISAGRARATIPSLHVEDFPVLSILAQDGFTHSFALSGDTLADLLEQCEFAISTEETRYYLNGIYCHVVETDAGHALRLVATDGIRLARVGTLAPAGADPSMPPIIIARKAVALIRDLCGNAGADPVTLAISQRAIKADAGALSITSKLIDGTFPDYMRVIPFHNALIARVPTKPLGRILEFCATLNLDKRPTVKLEFSDGRLVASLRNKEGADVRDELEAEFDGNFEIGIDAKYLSEILDRVDADITCIRLGDNAGCPMLIGERPDEALFVLMPMRA